MFKRNVVIVGDGAVGSTTAYTLMLSNFVKEISIIDVNKPKTEGDALDMMHGMPFVQPKIVKAGEYSDIANAHVVILTAGVGQKDGETRIDLLKRNIKVFDSIIEGMKPYIHDELIVLVVTNPVDILTYYTYKKLGIPSNRVIGSGTVLDTARLKSAIAEDTKVDARNIHTFVLGEHGDTEVAAFSVTTIGGLPLHRFCQKCGRCKGQHLSQLNRLHEKVKNAAYEIIAKKGATYYAVALAVNKIVETIINDSNSILTVSTLIDEEFEGVKSFYFSLPCIVNSKGIERVINLDYSEKERQQLAHSANTLKKIIDELNI